VLGSSAGNGTVDLAGFNQSVASLGTDPAASAAASQTIGNSAASTTATLTINGSSIYAGTIQDGLNGSGGRTAVSVAGGLVNLSGSNTYSGPTTINNGGTLQLGSLTALGAGANAGNLVANGLLDMAGYSGTVGAISGSGRIADSVGNANLNFGSAANSTFSGVFQALSLTQSGAGTFVLTGANSATTTTINQGTFQVGNGSLNGNAGSSQYSIASGARLLFNQGATPVTSLPWANITGGGTLELNDAAASGFINYSQTALPNSFFGTLQVDHRGIVAAEPAGLGSAATVVVNSGAQFLAYNGTAGTLTYLQNFSIAGLGSQTGSNSGAISVSTMNATIEGGISLTADSGLNTQGGSSVLTVTGPISGNYGLTIVDGNTNSPIVLAGSNSYIGTTNVAAGLLAVNGSLLASGSVTVAGGASLTGSGSVGAATVNSGGTIRGGYNSAGSLTLASLAFAGSANVYGALGNSTSSPAPIIVNGALTTSASTILVNITGTAPTVAGTYPFLQYSTLGGSGSASFQFASPLRAYSITNVVDGTNYIGITYTPGLYPIWTGSNSTAFVGGTNWKLSTDHSPTDYLNLDSVVFDDSAVGTTAVSVTQSVTPASTTFNNSVLSYTLSGTSGIGGAGSLTKSGTGGLLTITNANSYTGGTFVNGGTLQIGNGGTTGSVNGGVSVAAGATLVHNYTGNNTTITNSISGSGTWVLQGTGGFQSGSLIVSGNNTGFTGTVIIGSNTRYQDSAASALPGPGSTIAVQNGGQLWGIGAFNVGSNLTLSGSGWQENAGYLGAVRLSGGILSGNITLAGNTAISAFHNTGTITGVISGGTNQFTMISGSVLSSANDTLTLTPTAANTYGVTRVDSSKCNTSFVDTVTLVAGNANAFSSGPLSLSGTTNNIAVVALNGSSFSFADISSDNSFTRIRNGSASTASTMTVGGDNANTTYSGTLIDGGAATLALTMTGGNTLTLTGSNTYTGGTTVNGGTLIATNNEAIADGTSLSVGDPSLLSLLPAAVVPAPVASAAVAAPAVSPVPEPGTIALLALGLSGAAVCRRLRRRSLLQEGTATL
jgi:autotransporter-associated beta strand protein